MLLVLSWIRLMEGIHQFGSNTRILWGVLTDVRWEELLPSCSEFMTRVSAWVSSLLLVKTLQPGSWYNESVGKQLLNSGNLQRRVTFIPLNKIAGHRLDQRTIEAAKRAGGRDNVWFPLDLIDYDSSLEPAMCHLFGGSLLCRDLATANRVAYDMSGGVPPRGNDILCDLPKSGQFFLNSNEVLLWKRIANVHL